MDSETVDHCEGCGLNVESAIVYLGELCMPFALCPDCIVSFELQESATD